MLCGNCKYLPVKRFCGPCSRIYRQSFRTKNKKKVAEEIHALLCITCKPLPRKLHCLQCRRAYWRYEFNERYRKKYLQRKKASQERAHQVKRLAANDMLQYNTFTRKPKTLKNRLSSARKYFKVTPNSKKYMYSEFFQSAPPEIKEHVTRDLFELKNVRENNLDILADIYVSHAKDHPKSTSSYDITKSMTKHVQNIGNTVLQRKFKMSKKKVDEMKAGGAKRKINSRRITEDCKKSVAEFYLRDDISRPDPSNRAKTKKLGPRRYMYMPLHMAYTIFKDEFSIKWPERKIPVRLAKFKKLRPKNVKCFSQTPHESCLCVYCVNIRHKLVCLRNSHPDPKATNLPTNEGQFYNLLLCPRETHTFSNATCVNKECEHCKEWETTIKQTYSTLDQNSQVTYQFWEKEEYTTKKGKIRTRRTLVQKSETVLDCINNLIKDTIQPTRFVTVVRHFF